MPLLSHPEAATPRVWIVTQSLPPPALRGRAPTESPLAFTLHYTNVRFEPACGTGKKPDIGETR